jgi:lysophospholipase
MAFVRVAGNDEPVGATELILEGHSGLRIRAMLAPAPGQTARGTVLLCSGRTEFIEKYFEVTRELQGRGFTVFSFDWRGQGLSGRELQDPQKGHFQSFEDPVKDLALIVRQMGERLPQPHLLLAHSMGGAITLRALQTRRLDVAGAVFSSPMWGIPSLTPPVKSFASFATSLGAGGAFAPGFQHRWVRENFKRNNVTYDQERHARAQGLIAADPRLALAGPTFGWVAAAAECMDGFNAPDALTHIRVPVLVLSAAHEALVDNAAHARLARALPNCRHTVIENARHELMMERPPVRAQFWQGFDALAAQALAPNAVAG